ncbi:MULTISPECIES: homoserine/homoserine lactone efflux protein [unclassified Motilimonas]|uniref:homoserine/homoserine lactone efflux protein n=1 Tax=Motilimonas TaxID=1914248 RepID=UPI001E402C41|nr:MULTISPECIES: homoserine/homoserine lactone efflux protein [unclassified Motilimonas]MCE0555831.1 homoserine/homoserine lactone efflux protein [Motilimonas sp. E26]MDO6524120.1 homoserine/homoserine lactone efflux protein [Motilimonas sp. 1_MG-2023]
MTLEVWLAYLIAGIILSVSPGAGAVNTMSNGMNYGFKRALVSIIGLQVGLILLFVLVAIGLGALVAQSALAFNIIKWVGVGYLIYLGVMKFREQGAMDVAQVSAKPMPLAKLFSHALLVNVTNPKSIVFLVALLPQFIDPNAAQAPQFLILGTTSVLVDMVVMIGYALLATRLAFFIRSERHMRLQNRIFGGMFIGAGSLLAVASHK